MAKPDLPPPEPFANAPAVPADANAMARSYAPPFGGTPPSSMGQSSGPPDNANPNGLQNFQQNTDFLRMLHDPHYPEKDTGVHVPMWLAPNLANQVLMQHGPSGLAIPHPQIDLSDLSK